MCTDNREDPCSIGTINCFPCMTISVMYVLYCMACKWADGGKRLEMIPLLLGSFPTRRSLILIDSLMMGN